MRSKWLLCLPLSKPSLQNLSEVAEWVNQEDVSDYRKLCSQPTITSAYCDPRHIHHSIRPEVSCQED